MVSAHEQKIQYLYHNVNNEEEKKREHRTLYIK